MQAFETHILLIDGEKGWCGMNRTMHWHYLEQRNCQMSLIRET